MNAGPGFARIRSPSAPQEVISAVLPQPSIPNTMRRLEGRAVTCVPEQLRLHQALDELGWTSADELNDDARLKDQLVPEPILITMGGTILAGFGRWRLALFERRREIHCIEYHLSADEALRFILTRHQTGRGWNAFVRIRLALTLELYFQQRARDNISAGGKHKGSAKLPEAQRIDVRKEIAEIAGVSARNVTNVKMILEYAHPKLKEALRDGRLRINRAIQFCKLPRAEQLEQFIRYSEERETDKVIRRSIDGLKEEKTRLDIVAVLDALQQQEGRQPGSVVVRVGRLQRTVVLVGRDLLTATHSQKELKLP